MGIEERSSGFTPRNGGARLEAPVISVRGKNVRDVIGTLYNLPGK